MTTYLASRLPGAHHEASEPRPSPEEARYIWAEHLLDELLAAFDRMPDAGLDRYDPRYGWWIDSSPIRAVAWRFLRERGLR